jgi:hypothetical protein
VTPQQLVSLLLLVFGVLLFPRAILLYMAGTGFYSFGPNSEIVWGIIGLIFDVLFHARRKIYVRKRVS